MMMILMMTFSLNFLTLIIKKKNLNIFITNNMFLLTMMIFLLNNFKNQQWIKINNYMGMDYLSFNLMILTFWIMSIALYSNNKIFITKYNKMFINIMILLTNILMMCFSSMNLMIFYIFFETSLIPIMMIIMGWGKQIDRIQASMYMLFYTLIGSLPLLIMIMYMYMMNNNLMFNIMLINNNFMNFKNFIMYFMMTLAFLIKMPMFMVHLWLPKAHVEAPISGSIILAGIMLKLGSYGLYRMMIMSPIMYIKMNFMLMIFSMMGSLLCSLICLNQNDMKITVAYSSIVHMSILMSSMMTMFNMSMLGSLMLMIAHGLCSSGMFLLVNLNYERLKSRNNLINKGMINLMPSLTMWWFLIFSSNFSAPPSLNLFSEIFLFNSLVQWNYYMIFLIMMISFFSTCYSIFMFAFSQYGKMNFSFFNFKMINCLEFMMCFLLWMPLNLMFLLIKIMY